MSTRYPPPEVEDLYDRLLHAAGAPLAGEVRAHTPGRAAETWAFLTSGYHADLERITEGARFDAPSDALVIIEGVPFYSLCEHHLLPFFGTAHVGYVPGRWIIGLSKVSRLLEVHARRLQVQERLTVDFAAALEHLLEPRGLAVVLEGRHLCAEMRGEEKQVSVLKTMHLSGPFRDDSAERRDFFASIGNSTRPRV